MSSAVQEYLAAATRKAAGSLSEALLRIPEDKRAWNPEGKARSAINLIGECALLNGYTAELIRSRQWQDDRFAKYPAELEAACALPWEEFHALLLRNTETVIAAIRETPDADLGVEIAMPWETTPLGQIIVYPYWNMTYHEGQINYIASMLGCLP